MTITGRVRGAAQSGVKNGVKLELCEPLPSTLGVPKTHVGNLVSGVKQLYSEKSVGDRAQFLRRMRAITTPAGRAVVYGDPPAAPAVYKYDLRYNISNVKLSMVRIDKGVDDQGATTYKKTDYEEDYVLNGYTRIDSSNSYELVDGGGSRTSIIKPVVESGMYYFLLFGFMKIYFEATVDWESSSVRKHEFDNGDKTIFLRKTYSGQHLEQKIVSIKSIEEKSFTRTYEILLAGVITSYNRLAKSSVIDFPGISWIKYTVEGGASETAKTQEMKQADLEYWEYMHLRTKDKKVIYKPMLVGRFKNQSTQAEFTFLEATSHDGDIGIDAEIDGTTRRYKFIMYQDTTYYIYFNDSTIGSRYVKVS